MREQIGASSVGVFSVSPRMRAATSTIICNELILAMV